MIVSRRKRAWCMKTLSGLDSAVSASGHLICKPRDDSRAAESRRWELLSDQVGTFVGLGLVEERDGQGAPEGLQGVWWPLYFDDDDRNERGLDVCAVCFGALLHVEKLEDEGRSPLDDGLSRSALLTLVALRCGKGGSKGADGRDADCGEEYEGSWPSYVRFGAVYTKQPGTINQTTLALSALIRLGFLDVEQGSVLESRVEYVRESVEWLDGARCSTSMPSMWSQSYGPLSDEGASTLQTSFVYNTLGKVKAALRGKLERFRDDGKVSELVVNLLSTIDGMMGDIEGFFSKVNLASGACKSYRSVSYRTDVSVLGSCQLLHAMSNGLLGGRYDECSELVRALGAFLLDSGLSELVRREDVDGEATSLDRKFLPVGRRRFMSGDECFETVTLAEGENVPRDVDYFEVFPYGVKIMAFLKMLEVDEFNPKLLGFRWLSPSRFKLKRRIWYTLGMLKSRLRYTPSGVYVRGFRGGRNEFPIYATYYTRMLLSDLVGSPVRVGRTVPLRPLATLAAAAALVVLAIPSCSPIPALLSLLGVSDCHVVDGCMGLISALLVMPITLCVESLVCSARDSIQARRSEKRYIQIQD